MDMSGKTIIITGASRGIGAETAREFAASGGTVYLLGRSRNDLDKVSAGIGEKAKVRICDVSIYDDLATVINGAFKDTGRIDVLINNAGTIDPISTIQTSDPYAWGKAIDINLKGVFHGAHAVLPIMIKQGHGTIITVSSGAAHSPLEGWSQYCSSKAGAAMLTKCLHHETEQFGLRIMGLSPGTVATDMQIKIKASGVNPISALDPNVHIPALWPAKALLWMCGSGAEEFCGTEISLRDAEIRKRVGLDGF
jgi:NAD(P)-dependent dehydrogenase (short-subunit alcohol dehydrogenase family)